MRVADGIDIVLLHQFNVFFHQFFADCTAQLGMLMTVDPLYQYRYTVDAETSVFYFGSTETNLTTCYFGSLSTRVFQFQY